LRGLGQDIAFKKRTEGTGKRRQKNPNRGGTGGRGGKRGTIYGGGRGGGCTTRPLGNKADPSKEKKKTYKRMAAHGEVGREDDPGKQGEKDALNRGEFCCPSGKQLKGV